MLSVSFTSYSQQVTVLDSLKVLGKTQIQNNLRVDKCMQVKDTVLFERYMEVKGETKLEGDVYITGKATMNDDLDVQKNTNLEGQLNVKGETELKDKLEVQGETELKDKLEVAGDVELKKKLEVKKEAKFKNKIEVSGNARLKSNAIVFGNLKLKSLQNNNLSNDRILTLKPNGNVKILQGISSTNNYLLDVNGNMNVSGNFKTTTFFTDTLQTTEASISRIIPLSGDSLVHIGDSSIIINGNAHSIYAQVSTPNGATFRTLKIQAQRPPIQNADGSTQYNGNNNTLINPNYGRVGVGTWTPLSTFHVDGDSYFTNGQVAIGTTTPATGVELSVAGEIYAEEVVVDLQSNWPDYVFNNKYNLMTLNEIEQFIKLKHHLPNMPTEKEVKTNGLDVGEMLMLQQEKIEELFLYVIELEKKNSALETRLNTIEK